MTDHVDRLQELRDHLAGRLQQASDRDATAIGRLLRDLDHDLANLAPQETTTHADEIAARRAQRRANTEDPARTQRPG